MRISREWHPFLFAGANFGCLYLEIFAFVLGVIVNVAFYYNREDVFVSGRILAQNNGILSPSSGTLARISGTLAPNSGILAPKKGIWRRIRVFGAEKR